MIRGDYSFVVALVLGARVSHDAFSLSLDLVEASPLQLLFRLSFQDGQAVEGAINRNPEGASSEDKFPPSLIGRIRTRTFPLSVLNPC